MINLDYLEGLYLCKTKKVELIFLTTPLHSYFRDKVPDVYRHKYAEIIKSEKIKLIDLSTLTLTDDCFIPDGVHVSQKGSVVTSKQISDYELSLNNAPSK